MTQSTPLSQQLENTHAVFISDIHLSEAQPALIDAFNTLLDALLISKPNSFYILGDWFNSWIGDDWVSKSQPSWIIDLCQKLQMLKLSGTDIYFCHGNRDFLLGQDFLNRFSGELIKEGTQLSYQGIKYRLEHGDKLCTNDKKYQWFRRIIRLPIIKWFLLKKPLAKRQQIANNLRKKSSQNNNQKTEYIMDVNLDAVMKTLKENDTLIHGHTHRPKTHKMPHNKTRFVLGDWREKGDHVEAVIGILNEAGFHLHPCHF